MQARELAVDGAFCFTPRVFPDDRGLFVSPFQVAGIEETLGHPLFPVRQTNHSHSRRNVVRGVHYTRTPPGTAKYVYCPRGRSLDIVVDLRRDSPTFGAWDAVELDPSSFRAMYFPVGVGHAFVALEEDTVMSYLVSQAYVPEDERALSVRDAALGLPLPARPVLSDRDADACTVAEAADRGLLPVYADCRRVERQLYGDASATVSAG